MNQKDLAKSQCSADESDESIQVDSKTVLHIKKIHYPLVVPIKSNMAKSLHLQKFNTQMAQMVNFPAMLDYCKLVPQFGIAKLVNITPISRTGLWIYLY